MTDLRPQPIRDYALIGDCHGSALVSSSGSIDWCCLCRFDADPVFCRLLDADRGGFFSLSPEGEFTASRSYVEDTNILKTTFTTDSGEISVTDFMPVGRKAGSSVHDYVSLDAPCWLVRIVECVRGRLPLRVRYRPSVEFARHASTLEIVPDGVAANNGPFLQSAVPLALNGNSAEATVTLTAGTRYDFVLSPGPLRQFVSPQAVEQLLQITRAFWKEWISYCRYSGPYSAMVRRSALVLKALTYAPSGAIVAAPTTSLPDQIGGERNWDYRYCWPRDVAFTLYALSSLGYSGEARRFAEFIQGVCRESHPRVQVLYGVDGEADLAERKLDHLEGYRGSQPVRVGNGAHGQRQLDVFGEVLDWALLYRTLGGRLRRDARALLESLANYVQQEWQEPDHGIWEMRGQPRQYVCGKIMSWVAIDRAIRLFGETDELLKTREAIQRTILAEGVHGRSLVQAFGSDEMDASLLLAPAVAFPADQHILHSTVHEIQSRLGEGEYLFRYRMSDGLPGQDAPFLVCSFWMVDALLLLGEAERARRLYETLISRANDVGLFSEQVEPDTHEFLGNFPQALSHLGVVQAAIHLELFEQHGLDALRGSNADRARIHVEAVSGLRGLWAAFKKSGRVGRIRSSRDSMLRLNEF